MSKIVPFNFDGHPIRVVADDSGEPWFSANEICEVLGFANPRDAVARHVDADDVGKRDTIDSLGRSQSVNHVNESGLYALIFGSTKAEAKRSRTGSPVRCFRPFARPEHMQGHSLHRRHSKSPWNLRRHYHR